MVEKNAKKRAALSPLPMSVAEMLQRGWDEVDVVFVTGDAYVDHLSFATALLGRWLEKHGFRVAILAQPDWKSCEAWRKFGRPRLGFAVSAGNMDSMVNHYTANRKVRNVDAYSPGGKIGLRPDRATAVYCQRAREAFPGVPILAGGVEASLRRLAHYDYWSDKVRRSVLLDAKADILMFGMGELSLLEIVRRLDAGVPVQEIRDVAGTAYRLGASELFVKKEQGESVAESEPPAINFAALPENVLVLPSYEEVCADKQAFARMTKEIYAELNPYTGRPLLQVSGTEGVVVNPPQRPLTVQELDAVYDLPVTRREHPSYGEKTVPALQVVKDSVPVVRGCYGGCAFCAIAAHEGKLVQSRSKESVLGEIGKLASDVHFSGTISDLGGPTANMYGTGCKNPEAQRVCRRVSCLYPEICHNLNTDHGKYVELLRAARGVKNVRNVFIASGIRTDLARKSPEFIEELVAHHVGGHLKVAPEHASARVLRCMRKPPIEDFDAFAAEFEEASERTGHDVYLVPYFIASHPGSTLEDAVELAVYLHNNGYRPEQVQDFLPTPFDISTCMYYTGIDPDSGEEVYVARTERERKMQRAMLQYFMPENYFLVRDVLERTGHTDLIGDAVECLIPGVPPEGAGQPRVERADASRGGYRQRTVEDTSRREQRAYQQLQNSRKKEPGRSDRRDELRRRKDFKKNTDNWQESNWQRRFRDDALEDDRPRRRRDEGEDGRPAFEERRSVRIPVKRNKQEIDTWNTADEAQLKELRKQGPDYREEKEERKPREERGRRDDRGGRRDDRPPRREWKPREEGERRERRDDRPPRREWKPREEGERRERRDDRNRDGGGFRRDGERPRGDFRNRDDNRGGGGERREGGFRGRNDNRGGGGGGGGFRGRNDNRGGGGRPGGGKPGGGRKPGGGGKFR